MTIKKHGLCAIGNALVDILIQVDEAFLETNGILKGSMRLVDEAQANALYEKAPAAVELSSGGSAANTLSGFSSFGGKCAYLGRVGMDKFGEVFTHDLLAQGISFSSGPSEHMSTGRCLVFVTPDAQRSMCTYLGAAAEFAPSDLDAEMISSSGILYIEGYLFDKPAAQQALVEASCIAKNADNKVSVTLSDTFCVSRHRDAFWDLIESQVDYLFANEAEAKELCQTPNLDDCIGILRRKTELAVITRGALGAVVVYPGGCVEIPAYPPAQVIDTTGAGDLFAAGFLYGLSENKPLAECGRLGAMAASEVISHFGPRPQKVLKSMV